MGPSGEGEEEQAKEKITTRRPREKQRFMTAEEIRPGKLRLESVEDKKKNKKNHH